MKESFDPNTHRQTYGDIEKQHAEVAAEIGGEKPTEELLKLVAERDKLAEELKSEYASAQEHANQENARFDEIKVRMKELEREITDIRGEAVASVETYTQMNEQFLHSTFTSWYDANQAAEARQEAIIVAPDSQDYKALSESKEPAEFGKYTLNSETQGIDLEGLRAFIPDLLSFNGRPLHEVMKYVMDTYGATHYIPGIEYWKWLYENPGKNPPGANLKDWGEYYFFPGSVLRDRHGSWYVPYANWNGSEWDRSANWLSNDWLSDCRVLLLEK
jgi:hypothetical protein